MKNKNRMKLKNLKKFNENFSDDQKFTDPKNSYWNETGIYQKEYDELYDTLVPDSGEAETINGELIRAVSILAYDYYNNGNGNAVEVIYDTDTYECSACNGEGEIEFRDEEEEYEVCDECGGSGEIEPDYKVNDYYSLMLGFISNIVPNSIDYVNEVESVITDPYYSKYKANIAYNHLIDIVVYYVMNNEDSELSNWLYK